MKPILIGSTAIARQVPDFYRKPKDLDLVLSRPLEKEERRALGDAHGSPEVYNLLALHCTEHEDYLVPSLSALYTLKVSHIFWDRKNDPFFWAKHIRDIDWFQNQGAEFFEGMYKELYAYWETKKGKKPAYLNVPNEKFFTKAVNRKYIHDDIHEVMAYGDEPMYKKLKKDPAKALLSKKMFDALAPHQKDMLVREEVYVTALERFIIPSNFSNDPKEGTSADVAYRRAVKLLVTSMTKSWFPLYIVLNYSRLKVPDIDYIQKFKNKESCCRLLV